MRSADPQGHCPNGFIGLSLGDGTFLFLVILLDKTVSVFTLGRSTPLHPLKP